MILIYIYVIIIYTCYIFIFILYYNYIILYYIYMYIYICIYICLLHLQPSPRRRSWQKKLLRSLRSPRSLRSLRLRQLQRSQLRRPKSMLRPRPFGARNLRNGWFISDMISSSLYTQYDDMVCALPMAKNYMVIYFHLWYDENMCSSIGLWYLWYPKYKM